MHQIANKTAETAASTKPKRLSEAQLGQVAAMLKDIESVELKITIPATAHRATIRGLPLDPVEAEPRQVFFFDTPKLELYKAGIVVRARRMPHDKADTVIKLRPVVPADIPAKLRQFEACKVELDVVPGGLVCSASFKGKSTAEKISAVVEGKVPLKRLFSSEQAAFYRKYGPGRIELDDLESLGPTFLLKSQFWVKKLDRKVVAELWLYPDGSRLLELSTQVEPSDAFQASAEFQAWLARRGINTDGAQETKTAAALKFFSAHL